MIALAPSWSPQVFLFYYFSCQFGPLVEKNGVSIQCSRETPSVFVEILIHPSSNTKHNHHSNLPLTLLQLGKANRSFYMFATMLQNLQALYLFTPFYLVSKLLLKIGWNYNAGKTFFSIDACNFCIHVGNRGVMYWRKFLQWKWRCERIVTSIRIVSSSFWLFTLQIC